MENQMTSLKCRKCGATVSADQKKCLKCGAPILLKVMMEEEKRHLPAKEIREKDKRMRQEYAKMSKEKELERQKAEKKKQQLEEKAEKKRQKAKEELDSIRQRDEKKAQAEAEKASKQAEKEERKVQQATEKADKKLAKKAEKESAKSEKKNRTGLIVGMIIAVLVIAFGVAALFLNNSYKETPENVEEPEVIETAEEPEITEEAEVQEEPIEAEAPAEPEPEPEPQPETPKEPVKEEAPKRNITRNNYLFPSDTQYLTEADLNGLSKFDTGLIRNEIFARKGYVFKNEPYKSYFNSQAWYNPKPSAKIKLNDIEKYNNDFILQYERSQGWR
ncbi:MAG: YARHG domain-containing protein [Clostridia bacterium]|nr:YARHG domain-containing protein [Clostridia bacterium]